MAAARTPRYGRRMQRPLMAAMVSSTKPDLLSVSVWMATWVSDSVSHGQAVVDGRRGGAPVFVQLQANGPGVDLFVMQRGGQAGVALAQKPRFIGEGICGAQHRSMPGPGVQVVAKVPVPGRCRHRSWWSRRWSVPLRSAAGK